MGFRLVGQPRTVPVTRALALKFSGMNAINCDRDLSLDRVRAYHAELRYGTFRPTQWAEALCEENGVTYRVNGQHTSYLFTVCEPAEMKGQLVTLETYRCDTLEDVARLHATFDTRAQIRKVTDINLGFAATVPDLEGVSGESINCIVSGLGWYSNPNSPSAANAADRARLICDHVAFAKWAAGVVSGRGGKQLRRGPIIGAMACCYYVSADDANKFWPAVRDATAPTPNHPTRKLNAFITTNVVKNGGNSAARKEAFRIVPRVFYAKSITAWNAWRAGEPTDLKYFPNSDLPTAR